MNKDALLLPNAKPALYKETVVANQWKESIVNGIWTGILCNAFPTNTMEYILSPEIHFQDGRPDIFLVRNEFTKEGPLANVWTLIFEGKKGGGDSYAKILDQLSKYTTSLQTKQQVYLLGARGRTCAFWRYTKDVEDEKTYEQISVDSDTGNLRFVYDDTSTPIVHDIIDEQPEISAILTYILKNPLPIA